MKYTFTAFGHPNITARHRNTFELTKDKEVRKEGDCIIGVNADYSLDKIRELIKKSKMVRIELKAGNLKEQINAEINKEFDDEHEFVVRKTAYSSKRTFAINADKAARDFSSRFAKKLEKHQMKINITLEKLE